MSDFYCITVQSKNQVRFHRIGPHGSNGGSEAERSDFQSAYALCSVNKRRARNDAGKSGKTAEKSAAAGFPARFWRPDPDADGSASGRTTRPFTASLTGKKENLLLSPARKRGRRRVRSSAAFRQLVRFRIPPGGKGISSRRAFSPFSVRPVEFSGFIWYNGDGSAESK